MANFCMTFIALDRIVYDPQGLAVLHPRFDNFFNLGPCKNRVWRKTLLSQRRSMRGCCFGPRYGAIIPEMFDPRDGESAEVIFSDREGRWRRS